MFAIFLPKGLAGPETDNETMIKQHLVKIPFKFNESCQMYSLLTVHWVHCTQRWLSPMIDRHCPNVVSNMLNSNTESETSFYTTYEAERKGWKSILLQPRHTANEKHACHDNGYGFLRVCVAHVLFPCSAEIFIYSAAESDWWVNGTGSVFLHIQTSITRCAITV